ncbi:DNA repair protein RecO [bacterium]|nr:DNA repair protein RecO [bacterium]
MPNRNQSFAALILRAKDSPSGDRIVTLLSAEEGIVDAFVFGGARSSLRSAASPFVYATAFLYVDPVKHYRKLSDLAILETFSGLRETYPRLWSASVIAELVIRTSGCGGEYAEVLDLSLRALKLLSDADERLAELTLLSYLWKSLGVMGLQPDPGTCSSCGRPLSGMRFSAAHEGFVCDACDGEGAPMSPWERRCLAAFNEEGLEACVRLAGEARGQDAASTASLKGVIYYLAQKAAEGTLATLAAE